jgi:hypothetical protein
VARGSQLGQAAAGRAPVREDLGSRVPNDFSRI